MSETDVYNYNALRYIDKERYASAEPIWINPVGGLGDVVMLSTVLQHAYRKYGRRFQLARRTRYTELLDVHPAIESVGHPQAGADVICNDYWSRVEYEDSEMSALNILKRMFGVEDVPDDELYLPEYAADVSTRLLVENIPWQRGGTVVVSVSSDSIRKMMSAQKWQAVVDGLLARGMFVIQTGMGGDVHLRGAYSLLGVTTPLQLLRIVAEADAVVCLDSFIMHAAKAMHTPAVVLFGPTEVSRYGYTGHRNLQVDMSGYPCVSECIGPHVSMNYGTPCPQANQCMDDFDTETILQSVMEVCADRV